MINCTISLGIDSSGGGNGTGHPPADMVSPGSSTRRSKHSSSSLAEDILAIRAALEGASDSARQRTLNTLERLTARLALAESERDTAIGKGYFQI